jgi:hypothetical protein
MPDRGSPGRSPRRRRGWLAVGLITVLWTAGCAADAQLAALISSATAPTAATGGVTAPTPAPPAEPSTGAESSTGAGVLPEAADRPSGGACPAVRCVSIAVTGDVLLHPPLVEQAIAAAAGTGRDLDFAPMLAGQRPYLESADLAICHLETPVSEPEGPFAGYPMFSVPPQVLDGLVATGYDACTTASNHTLDQGFDGAVRTLDALDAAGLAHDGSYRSAAEAAIPTVVDTPAARIGLISVTYGLNTGNPDEPWMVPLLDPDAVIARARAARAAGADLVLVSMHAGTEYETEPNSEQRAAAQALLADPAIDLLYGHHAHVVQPMEKINGKWVIYGLGNMVASHETPIDETREGLLVRVTFGMDDAGHWVTTDVAWVPSLQDFAGSRDWCPLTAETVCTSPAAHDLALTRTGEAVNLYGADRDGARLWDSG